MSDGVQILSSVPESLLTTATVQDIGQGELVTSGTPIEIIHTSPETIAALLPKNGQAVCQDAETSIAHSGGNQNGAPTLQSLLATPVTNGQLQIITVTSPAQELLNSTQSDGGEKVWQVVPSSVNPEIATIIAVNTNNFEVKAELPDVDQLESIENSDSNEVSATISESDSGMMLVSPLPQPSPQSIHSLPPNCPSWAARLHSCQMIGNSFRGYVESEIEVDLLLTYHKQQTHSYWGTRQSPSPAKPSTRLMWKSQYVPFDGIPFVNSGSRAIVMECQFGPRRKGNLKKKQAEQNNKKPEYTQTCPARIYIKKVKKFPEFTVDLMQDKRSLKISMDKRFQELKSSCLENIGQERYYVQLPTENAHEFHAENVEPASPKYDTAIDLELEAKNNALSSRLHPRVQDKIREMVAAGESRIYVIRKQLRNFVTKELYPGNPDNSPERHDLTLFPTVNDLKNHIHQALKDIGTGKLPYTSPAQHLNLEIIASSDMQNSQDGDKSCDMTQLGTTSVWNTGSNGTNNSDNPNAVPETVTVTFTQNPGEDGQHVISRIETHLSDGTTQVSTSLTPETAQLLSKIHPSLISAGSFIQLPSISSDVMNNEPLTVTSAIDDETNISHDQQCEELHSEISATALSSESVTTLQVVPADSSQYIQTADGTHQIVEATHLVDGTQLVETGSSPMTIHEAHIIQADGTAIVQTDNVQLLPPGLTAQIVNSDGTEPNSRQLITVAVNGQPGSLVPLHSASSVEKV
ncbi:calcium-responsive transcription factor-like isoform X1 [Octopus sinensis]|uniref:Calcium-responsive transcription factor-like isoform X1 n=1 Tax=Octopus sinensis TaxID=2607531 RepID=A0A7E6FSJ1_9MOLL|nr:calcium-responsive transcription factor-like isoform X1 [Octopus sinensis]